ncbi:MAG: hypothetical protein U1F23_02635 [Lysobacterales bacterium]
MNHATKLTAIALATAAAGFFTLNAAHAADQGGKADTAQVKCMNSSSCKGHGACKTANNSCKGQNACKGQGFTMQKSDAACKAAQEAAHTSM